MPFPTTKGESMDSRGPKGSTNQVVSTSEIHEYVFHNWLIKDEKFEPRFEFLIERWVSNIQTFEFKTMDL